MSVKSYYFCAMIWTVLKIAFGIVGWIVGLLLFGWLRDTFRK